MNIGERQTVQHAKHPTLGEGRLVYDNGPAFFIADSGEVEHYRRKLGSGARSGPPVYSWVEVDHDGKPIELETTDRKRGPFHRRIVTLDGRRGWLVSWNDEQSIRERFQWERFEPDDGPLETMMIQVWWVGKANEKNSKKKLENLRPWLSMESIGGHHFTYCNESGWPGDHAIEAMPTPAKPRKAPKASCAAKPTMSATPLARPWPSPDATRAEIEAWRRGQ